MNIPKGSSYDILGLRDPNTGDCKYLTKSGDIYECSLGMLAPYNCVKGECAIDGCCVRYR